MSESIGQRLNSLHDSHTLRTLAAMFQQLAPLTGSATWDPASAASGAQSTTTVTVAGAAIGDFCQATFSLSQGGMVFTAYVSAANTVTVVASNTSGSPIDLTSGTVKVRVWPQGNVITP